MNINRIIQIYAPLNVQKEEKTHIKNFASKLDSNKPGVFYPSTYYMTSGVAFCAQNVEIIELMKKVAPKNVPEKLTKLFEQMSNTVQNNVKEVVKNFNIEDLTLNNYIQACIKHVQLFYQSPKTTENNVKGIVDIFKNEGVTIKDYISACLKQPQLFYQSPETIENNVKGLVEIFKSEGLTLKDYLSACLKQPPLFCLKPETIENNIRNLAEKFSTEGLTPKDYISVCVRQPQLFYQSPETIENNVKNLIERFKINGLTSKDYVQACQKQPPLFCQKPDTIAQHIDIIRFSKFNTGHQTDTPSFWQKLLNDPVQLSYSNSLLLTRDLIIPKMFEGTKTPKELKGKQLKQKLNNYLKKNTDKKFVLNIKEMRTDTDCINILSEYLEKLTSELGIPNDTFKININ